MMHMEVDYTGWKAHVSCKNMPELKKQTNKQKTVQRTDRE